MISVTKRVLFGAGVGGALSRRWRSFVTNVAFALVALMATASAASAETLLMPDRDYLMGTSEVVWGITTQANGTAFTLNYGDASPNTVGIVADRSYIAFNHTYTGPGPFTVTLTVGAEVATTHVRVFNAAVLSAADLRGLNINRSIEDGLRYLWVTQSNRTTFDTNPETSWDGSYPRVGTSLVVLAFENHGYKVPNNANPATGVYPKYAVQRGLNFIVANLQVQTLNTQPAGNPCVGAGIEATNCVGLYNPDSDPGYGTSIAAVALLGSSALSRTAPAGLAGATGVYVAGKTLGEIAQRVMNTVAWGQNDTGCVGRGGWYYSLTSGSCTTSDGSTVGWNVLALLDAAASGIAEPAFVATEFAFALTAHGNTDGSFDYNADGTPAFDSYPNLARAGIYLQSLYYEGVPLGDARVTAAINFINARWSGVSLPGDYTGTCGFALQNKGCAYGMYNAFKGLKLYGVLSLPAASDWYAEYQDYLVSTQTSPTTTGGGNWGSMSFSCCFNSTPFNSAIAELILAPVALITPDPGLFATVGLSPATAFNPIGTNHTVTAFAQATGGAPVPGVTINFSVLTGPNSGKTGSGTTGIDGKVSFTYSDTGGAGTDTIQAFIGTTGSNVVTKTWQNPTIVCDVNGDGKVTNADLLLIRAKNGQAATGPTDPYDPNHDLKINVADVRYCQLRLTPP
ncbi:MAG: hypothetical protein ABI886_14435 [Betaproteobacteria bacterium]